MTDYPKHVRTFNLNFEKIAETDLYKLIKSMPKGALLHTHVSASLDVKKYLEYLKKNNKKIYDQMYIITDASKVDKYNNLLNTDDTKNRIFQYLLSNQYVIDGLEFNNINISVFKNSYWNFVGLRQKDLHNLIRFSNGAMCEGYTPIKDMSDDEINHHLSYYKMPNISTYDWKTLNSYTNYYWTLYRDVDYYLEYYKCLLYESIDDGLCHIEIKQSFGNYKELGMHTVTLRTGDKFNFYLYQDYSTNKKTLKNNIDEILQLNNNTEFKDKISLEIILGNRRDGVTDRSGKIINEIPYDKETVATLKEDCATYDNVRGIDLFSEEDKGLINSNYVSVLINECKDKNYLIHTGETITDRKSKDADKDDNSVNSNALTMAMLRASDINEYLKRGIRTGANKIIRIGHGLALQNNEALIKLYKDLKIHVELCPLSNYILNYVDHIRNHPGKIFLKKGLRVSINSDDPYSFGYSYVTYDWLFVIMYWDLTLEQIKKMAVYSIEDSSLSLDNKKIYLTNFENKWNVWKNEVIRKIKLSQPPTNIDSLVIKDYYKKDIQQIEDDCKIPVIKIMVNKKDANGNDVKDANGNDVKEEVDYNENNHQINFFKNLNDKKDKIIGENETNETYFSRYLKYKSKYLKLKNQLNLK